MAEKHAMSDDVFELLRTGGSETDAGLRFRCVVSTRWKRSRSAPEQHMPRPHIIGVDEEARSFIAKSFFFGIGVPVGDVFVDGEWRSGLRFIDLPESSAAGMIVDLEEMMGEFSRPS